MSLPMCRKCIRDSHRQAPFHRIECWTGSFFRPAALWEVGTYLLVRHHLKEGLCESLQFQTMSLDSLQYRKDRDEQLELRNKSGAPAAGAGAAASSSGDNDINMGQSSPPVPDQSGAIDDGDVNMTWNDEAVADAAFEAGLDSWLNDPTQTDVVNDNLDSDSGSTDIPNVNQYLGPYKDSDVMMDSVNGTGADNVDPAAGADIYTGAVPSVARPTADALNNSYVRILHTNGIHHLGMITCSCQGSEIIPLDLVACRLLPASFNRIRTIFTAQLMDYFRLCNLELKASAYQFYQLIRRLTFQMGQTEIANLYHQ